MPYLIRIVAALILTLNVPATYKVQGYDINDGNLKSGHILPVFGSLDIDDLDVISEAVEGSFTPKNDTSSSTLLERISLCESGGKQFNENGDPIKNPSSSAIGKYQIMFSIHKARAQELGLDVINSEEDNEAFAVVLFNEQGTTPWEASRECWNK